MNKIVGFLVLFFVSVANAQLPFPDGDSLCINNLNVMSLVHGDIWHTTTPFRRHCMFSEGSRQGLYLASAVWLSAVDASGNLHVAAQTYRQNGNDFWPGPLDASGNLDYSTSAKWAKVWKVSRSEVNIHRAVAFHNLSNTPQSILSWPGKGNVYATGRGGVPLDVPGEMAPFVDRNGDGIYQPLSGEYPDFNGDGVLWWVFSDNGPTHDETNGSPLKVEVRAMAYGYKRSTPIDNVVYYDYEIVNRSGGDYTDMRFAIWNDPQLHAYEDTYIAFDSARRLGIIYSAVDSGSGSSGIPSGAYGANQPAAGVTFVKVPGDGGAGFVPVGSYTYYNNDPSIIGNPSSPSEYDRYMRARLRNGDHINKNGVDVDYIVGGDPFDTSEIMGCAYGSAVGDMRTVMATRGFSLVDKRREHIVFALVADSSAGGCPTVDLGGLNTVADTAWNVFHNPLPELDVNDHTAGLRTISIYPNPVHDLLEVEGAQQGATVVVTNVLGATVATATYAGAGRIRMSLHGLPVGLYVVRYTDAVGTVASTVMKQ